MRRFFGVMSVVVEGFFAVGVLTLRANEKAAPKGPDEDGTCAEEMKSGER